MNTRTASIDFSRDLRPGSGLHWRLTYSGDGHWCRANGHIARFSSRVDAETAAGIWIATGTPVSRQTDAQRADAQLRRAA